MATSVPLALHGKPLPCVEDTVRARERLRLSPMGRAKRVFDRGCFGRQ